MKLNIIHTWSLHVQSNSTADTGRADSPGAGRGRKRMTRQTIILCPDLGTMGDSLLAVRKGPGKGSLFPVPIIQHPILCRNTIVPETQIPFPSCNGKQYSGLIIQPSLKTENECSMFTRNLCTHLWDILVSHLVTIKAETILKTKTDTRFPAEACLQHYDIKAVAKNNSPRNRLWRPIGLWDVKDPTLSRQSVHS
jgi:hypothetical protein